MNFDKDKNDLLENISKLQWACRRGMLELDVLLSNFLNEAYAAQALEDKLLFIELLSYEDPVIFAWIMGHETPAGAGMVKITEAIRQHARSRV